MKISVEKKTQELLDFVEKSQQDKALKILQTIINSNNNNSLVVGLGIIKHTKLDLPEIKERLEYVIEITTKAAEETLFATENLSTIIKTLEPKENSDASNNLEQAKHEIMSIMTSQSFQDLTGQVINRVIKQVSSLEKNLHELISSAEIDIEAVSFEQTEKEKCQAEMKGIGPSATKSGQQDTISSQADIDDLLNDLGI